MTAKTNRTKLLSLGLTGAIALAIVAGSGFSDEVVARPTPDKTAAAAQAALARGQVDRAISLGEAVVAASPREPAYRALLAHAYLKAGRFESAATTFDDAMQLGDTSARTALGLALAHVGAGRSDEAVTILDDWRDAIPVADLGLAMALAGEATRGSAILADALRGGENTPKLRQNLAYSYALDGRWREARLMMSQDVPANEMDARISEWAAQARPEDFRVRVAGMIKAPLRSDPGQPARLALNANPADGQLAAAPARDVPQLAAAAPAETGGELPVAQSAAALASYVPVTARPVEPVGELVAAAQEPAPAAAAKRRLPVFVANPVIQPLPQTSAPQTSLATRQPRAAAPVRSRVAAAPVQRANPVAADTHRVQLASFFTEQGARQAWAIYAARNPELRQYRMTITKAEVGGRTYYRVAAAGLNGSQGARNLCGAVKARGMGCFAYATSTGVPGTRAANAPMLAQAKAPASPASVPRAGRAGPALARKR